MVISAYANFILGSNLKTARDYLSIGLMNTRENMNPIKSIFLEDYCGDNTKSTCFEGGTSLDDWIREMKGAENFMKREQKKEKNEWRKIYEEKLKIPMQNPVITEPANISKHASGVVPKM